MPLFFFNSTTIPINSNNICYIITLVTNTCGTALFLKTCVQNSSLTSKVKISDEELQIILQEVSETKKPMKKENSAQNNPLFICDNDSYKT